MSNATPSLMTLLLGLIALVLFGVGIKSSLRVFSSEYSRPQRHGVRETLISGLSLSAAFAFLLLAFFSAVAPHSVLKLFPIAFGIGFALLVMGIIRADC